MTANDKAQRATVQIGSLSVDGFQMPDGSYRMSQTSAADAVGIGRQNVSDFLRSKAIKALLGEGYTGQIFEVEVENTEQRRGQARINAIPIEVVIAYWHWQSHRGNKQALQLCIALATETLERRFDAAFGVERSESDRNLLLAQRLQQTESALSLLGEAYAEPDLLRMEVEHLRQQLIAAGLEPWRSPDEVSNDG
ncbi:hypothetical protein GFS31_41660 (plasmid) [Leptolyngbya sp. BL0902]|uniref:hypothetical protein n=1 Tax=Leptolyngbya sp. BL0902 TaxID=1115757 RepID=UPI0018E852DF|nr:hypothetical protein [Leptolyngbya sp. BL0902]QQE67453.1 hypothetical protein GFS31_41660 [Leptolyngbya sp. BL0902]